MVFGLITHQIPEKYHTGRIYHHAATGKSPYLCAQKKKYTVEGK